MRNEIINEYFEWLYDMVCGERFSNAISYKKLLSHLHTTTFTYSIPNDKNRAEDGIGLRYRFALYLDDLSVMDDLRGPCSVLEMMAGLSVRCEEIIMDDPDVGDRTGQWFWGMIANLGLSSMVDNRFDRFYVDEVIDRLLNREYEPNGAGGLFTVRHRDVDLRDVEIWYQLCWYLNSIV
jgi:hypothetical protein